MCTVTVSSPVDHDKLPRAMVLRHAVVVDRPPAVVFQLLATNDTARYRKLARGHLRFDVRGGGPLHEGAVVDCSERAENHEVHHVYRVTTFVPNREIAMESLGSRGLVHAGGRTYEAKSNTFVRHTIEPLGDAHARVSVVIAIQFMSVTRKLLALATGSRRIWTAHMHEEMAGLAALAAGDA